MTQFLLSLLLLGCLHISPSFAENKLFIRPMEIVITSEVPESHNEAHTALFKGSVSARTDTMTMYSDSMLVYYTEWGHVTKIDAAGHVKMVSYEQVITSDAATYFAETEKAIFTGDPRAIEGGKVVSGSRIIYLIKQDSSLSKTKIFNENKKK